MVPCAGSLSFSATVAGRMLASSASERLYSTSMASSAREISRMAYQTVANISRQAPAVANTNPALSAQRG